jgi:hypothetical protein
MNRFIYFLAFLPLTLFGQEDTVSNKFTFHFNEGIYTSFSELVNNSPKYLNCKLEICIPLFGRLPYYNYNDPSGNQYYLENPIFATVNNSTLFLYYKNYFYKSYCRGPITLFVCTNWKTSSQINYELFHENICILDFENGEIGKLEVKFIDSIIRRDPELYKEFHANKVKKDKNNLIRFILKYNDRNPFHL